MGSTALHVACLAAALTAACAASGETSGDDSGATEDLVEPFVITDAPEDLGPGIDVVTFIDEAPQSTIDRPPPALDVTAADTPSPGTDVARDTGTAVTDTGPACAAGGFCGGCVALAGCGWCTSSSSCEPGGAGGPSSGTCASWAGSSGACMALTDPCTTSTDCGTCTAAAGCGWCGATRSCASGTMNGPTFVTCSASWAWVTSDCSALPGDSCGSNTSCVSCDFNSSCGWCSDSSTCHSGSSANPDDHACAGSHWAFRTVECI